MTEIITYIPTRLKSAVKGGYVTGAADIIDDVQGLSQERINSIVLGNAVSVSLTATKDSNNSAMVKLTASCSIDAQITIYRGTEEVATVDNAQSLVATHAFQPNTATLIDSYKAVFKIGDYRKEVTANAGGIFVVCGEDWTDAQGVSPDAEDTYIKTSPAGTYSVNVNKYVSIAKPGPFKVYFIIPRSMSISGATMGGFNFPLQSGANSTFQGLDCKYYESSNDYPEGVLTIKIS